MSSQPLADAGAADQPPVTENRATLWAAEALLVVLALSVLVPLILMVGSAFKPAQEMYSPIPWPKKPTLDNFRTLFDAMPFGAYLWNSIATSALRVAGQLLTSIMAAYVFARYTFFGSNTLFLAVLGAMMIPHQLTMIPIYLLVVNLGWYDTFLGLIVPNLAAPFGIFLLRQHIRAIPNEILDAAVVDGANNWQTMWHVVLPMVRPAIAALTIILFIDCWNEYFWPMLITNTERSTTVQLGLRRFVDGEGGDAFGPLMAGMILASLPIFALFFFFQRKLFDTFAQSGVKG
ncbi:MAG: carbohydrate ABC transporter permease [Rhizobiales bacterium]|nr:carbohydrate ABC transporter permease [Hyphomicrobiales bacterium]OJU31352.1 MAG: hypothetical protein BGN94_14130 [Rhizobiales bacterium 68-8]